MVLALALALLFSATASASPPEAADGPGAQSASRSAASGYTPYFRGSWTFLNGTHAQRAAVRRVVRRMRFPRKAFLGRFVAFRFRTRGSHVDRGWAGPKNGYVLITLYPGWNRFVIAHEIGHAADFALLGDADRTAFARLVGRHAPRRDCLSSRVKWRRSWARLHSCRREEEWASGFARTYCCWEAAMGIEGKRIPRRRFGSFARRKLRPQDNGVTRLVRVSCYFAATLSIDHVTPAQCRRRQGMPNPTLVICSYGNSVGQRVSLRLEQGECSKRIALAESRAG